eukprot:8804338-Pyramimonas_sp.AAC.1
MGPLKIGMTCAFGLSQSRDVSWHDSSKLIIPVMVNTKSLKQGDELQQMPEGTASGKRSIQTPPSSSEGPPSKKG